MRQTVLTAIFALIVAFAPEYGAACACCGLDNWWSLDRQRIDDYYAKLLADLAFVDGQFDDSPDTSHYYKVRKVKQGSRTFSMETEIGTFEFQFTDAVEHRAADITFITQPQYELDDVADIYHEIILRGTLKLPKKPATILNKNRVPATLVFQGIGGACLDADLFKKWVLRIEGVELKASGKLEKRQQPN
jgi:hypothetical protein